jgi:hypothetical protein
MHNPILIMQTSNETNEIFAALARAQGEFSNAPKESKNPFFNSTYADLGTVIDVVRDGLHKNGLAVVQAPTFDGELAHVETRIIHASGQWMSFLCSAPVIPVKTKPATIISPADDSTAKYTATSIGATFTLLRRYSLSAALNIGQEDPEVK